VANAARNLHCNNDFVIDSSTQKERLNIVLHIVVCERAMARVYSGIRSMSCPPCRRYQLQFARSAQLSSQMDIYCDKASTVIMFCLRLRFSVSPPCRNILRCPPSQQFDKSAVKHLSRIIYGPTVERTLREYCALYIYLIPRLFLLVVYAYWYYIVYFATLPLRNNNNTQHTAILNGSNT